MKRQLIVLIGLLCLTSVSSQMYRKETELIGSCGSSQTAGQWQVSFSVGELVIDQSKQQYRSGFHQSYSDSVISTNPTPNEFNTIITPNGDGFNDNLVIEPGFNSTVQVIVLDKWGTIVYKEEDYSNNWNGTHTNGKPLQDGVYIYYITNQYGNTIYKGTITIKNQ